MLDNAELYQYMLSVSLREPELFAALRAYVVSHDLPAMHVSPEQGQLMAFLIKLTQAKKILELGTYVGYSTLWLASAIPDDGKIITCDIDTHHQETAQSFWQKTNMQHKINQQICNATELLEKLLSNEAGTFDAVFIDADKQNYPIYYEKSLALIKSGGLIMIDNMFLNGRVLKVENATGRIMRELSEKLHHDNRIDFTIITIRDGLGLARKL